MSSTKKTIQINPELFKVPGSAKTKKVRDKKTKPIAVNPNALKKKLLSRIKEHKKRETAQEKPTVIIDSERKTGQVKDEFDESIEYLNILSKQNKKKGINEVHKKQKEKLNRKTLKNPSLYMNNGYNENTPMVQLELPDELKETLIPVTIPPLQYIQPTIPEIHINTAPETVIMPDTPYGCLKNGSKPTYREWHNKTRKNPVVFDDMFSLDPDINPNAIPSESISSREKKLEVLRDHANKQKEIAAKVVEIGNENIITTITDDNTINLEPCIIADEPKTCIEPIQISSTNKNTLSDIVSDIKENNSKNIKRTVKRKYNLGKSKINRKVGLLIKNNNTRKQVLDAHKDLKRESINDVKKYLKKHGFLKAGSLAPNDVVRKMYESTMLTGDITNTNKDILMHNFMHDKD
jgi:hypothetical protein